MGKINRTSPHDAALDYVAYTQTLSYRHVARRRESQVSCALCMHVDKRGIDTVHFVKEIADDNRAFYHEGLVNVITQSCQHLVVRRSAVAFVIYIEHHVA